MKTLEGLTIPCEFGALLVRETGNGVDIRLRRPSGLERRCATVTATETGIEVTTYADEEEKEEFHPPEGQMQLPI